MTRSIVVILLLIPSILAAEWYASNSLGIQGALVDLSQEEPPEYLLEVIVGDSGETRRLVTDNREIKRWEVTRSGQSSTEEFFENGSLAARSEFDAGGLVVRETRFVSGAPVEIRGYQYAAGLLTQRSLWDAEETLLEREQYRYWSDGSLRSIVREEPSGRVTEFRYQDGRLLEEWVNDYPGDGESSHHRYRYDTAGRLTGRVSWTGETITATETRLYWSDQSDAAIKSVRIEQGDRVIAEGYNPDGLILERDERIAGDLVARRVFRYDDTGLLQETETGDDGTREWRYVNRDGVAIETR